MYDSIYPSSLVGWKCSYPLDDASFYVHAVGGAVGVGRESFMRIPESLAETLCDEVHKHPLNKEGVVVGACDSTDHLWVVTRHDDHYYLVLAYMEA